MKKVITIVIAMAILLNIPLVSFGTSEYEVSLESIDNIVQMHSSYKKESDQRNNKIYSDYLNYKVRLSNVELILAGMKSDDPLYEEFRDEYIQLTNSAWSADYDVKISNLTEKKHLNMQGQLAKEEYIKYLKQLKSQEDYIIKLSKEEDKIKTAEKKYKRGLISLNSLNELKEGLDEIIEENEKAKEEIDKQKENLFQSLGLNNDDTLKISSIVMTDEVYKSAVDVSLEEDLKQVMNNSIDIKKAQLVADRALIMNNQYSTEYKEALKELNDTKKKTEKDFRETYKNLKESVKKIDKQTKKIKLAYKKYKVSLKKYRKGLISVRQLNEDKDMYLNAKNIKEDMKIDLLIENLRYQLVKRGF